MWQCFEIQVQCSYVVILCSWGSSSVCFLPRSKDMQITVFPIHMKVYLWPVLAFSYIRNKLFSCNPENAAILGKWVKLAVLQFNPLLRKYFLGLSRTTPVRAEAAVAEEEEQGMKTTRSPPSHPPTMLTPLCCTSWNTSQVTPSTPCLTTACSTPTPTLSCLPSWCPTCWARTPTSSRGLCTRWVHLFFVCPLLAAALCDCAGQALWCAISRCGQRAANQPARVWRVLHVCVMSFQNVFKTCSSYGTPLNL